MDLQLTGKRAIVSGGSKGIGWAIARTLAVEGASVAIVARGEDVPKVAEDLAVQTGARVIGVRADTGDQASVERMVATVIEALGGVDILVNTAATPWSPDKNTRAIETSDDQMRAEFQIKVLGYLRTARAAAPYMVEQGWGRIINIAGLGARSTGSVAQTVRNISVSAITKTLADELGPSGINAVVVHPSITRTPALTARLRSDADARGTTVEALEATLIGNSVHRMIDADDVANVVAFLASPLSVAITGDAVAVGGGVPGPIYY